MANGTTVGGESARYCDTSISTSFYDLEQETRVISGFR